MNKICPSSLFEKIKIKKNYLNLNKIVKSDLFKSFEVFCLAFFARKLLILIFSQ